MTQHQESRDGIIRNPLTLRLFIVLGMGVVILACGESTASQPPILPAASEVIAQPTSAVFPSEIPLIDTPTSPPVVFLTDTALPPPTATQGCASGFNCSASNLPPLVVAAGGPNDPGFQPCAVTRGFPWISVETENRGSNDLQRGQRAYYFACEFSDANTITAEMSGPGGSQTLSVFAAVPNLDLHMNLAQRVAVWNATCDLPIGTYTLDIRDGNGNQSQLIFNLTETNFQRILTIPQSAPVGTAFQVYYCGYGAQAGQEVLVDLYYGVQRADSQGTYDFYGTDSWSVFINADGWAAQTLQSFPGDAARAYLINDRDGALEGYDMLWLSP